MVWTISILAKCWRTADKTESLRVIVSQCNIDVILFVCLWYCLCNFLCYRAVVSFKTLSCTLQRNQARQRASEFARDLTHPRCFVQPIFHVCLMHGTHFWELLLKFKSDWMSIKTAHDTSADFGVIFFVRWQSRVAFNLLREWAMEIESAHDTSADVWVMYLFEWASACDTSAFF